MSSHPRPTSFSRSAAARAGFTLIELLTVIAIIGVLASIIIPTVGKVRKTAQNAKCVSNLRMWAQAVQLYAQDNKGNYVIRANIGTASGQTWAGITNVMGNMHYAPYMGASTNIGTMRFCPTHNSNTSGLCYYINRPYVRGTTVAPLDKVPFSMVRNPSKFMLFVDVDTEAPGTNGFALIGPGGLASHVTPLFSIPQKDRHSGRANMVFGDGHVQAVTQADILAFGDTWTRIDN